MQTHERIPARILGLGTYLPDRVLTNEDLEQMVDTSDKWITRRTGIKTRRLAADDEATSDLAVAAAREALDRAELDPEQLDAIIVATITPDYPMPATACLVQNALGATNAFAYDLEAACSGFVFGMSTGSAMIGAGLAQHVLVIGAECLSRVTDYTDRGSCILFGDGAGAAVLGRSDGESAVLYHELGADGSQPDILKIPAGGSARPMDAEALAARDNYMHLAGRDVFKQAVTKLSELLERMVEDTGVSLDEIKCVVPHQSNIRIVDAAFKRVDLSTDKAYMNIDRVGNTSAASIPIALAEAVEEGVIERGDLVLLMAFGGGLTWGITLVRF
jgi:3-oxoacyl-[acyl-carrier-protein] synthase-3